MSMVVNSTSDNGSMIQINTTPLIDVMLCLLVILVMSIPVMTHAVKVTMPQAPSLLQPSVVEIEIDFDGTVLWNGAVVNREQLVGNLHAAALTQPQPDVRLRSNPRVKYDHVAQVLATAQRLGIQKLGFVGNENLL